MDDTELDKILDKYWDDTLFEYGTEYAGNGGIPDYRKTKEVAKEAILNKYIAKADLVAAIGEDEVFDGRVQSDLKKDGRNDFRAQLRKELNVGGDLDG